MYKIVIAFSLMLLSAVASANGNEQNWRSLFPNVPSIKLADMASNPGRITLVDVRSKFHFDQSHLDGAHNISLTSPTFVIQMQDLQAANKGKTIVVYCDSDNCIKAYRAVDKCHQNGIKNVVLYDASVDNNVGNIKLTGSRTESSVASLKM